MQQQTALAGGIAGPSRGTAHQPLAAAASPAAVSATAASVKRQSSIAGHSAGSWIKRSPRSQLDLSQSYAL